MRRHPLRETWRAGGAAVDGWLALPSAFLVETLAHQGWASLTIDLQHGVVDDRAMVGMLQAISTTESVPVARVPWLEPALLMKSLDAGAYDNLDAILSVEGLDAIYIGPADLSLAAGCAPTFDDLDPKAAQAVEHFLDRAQAHGTVAGIHNRTPEPARRRIAEGFQFVTVGSDARLMAAGAHR